MKKEKDTKWILSITIIAFVISFIFSLIAELVIPNAFIVISIFLVFIFIFLGIIFDIIGVAISVSDQKSFHSMATKRVSVSGLPQLTNADLKNNPSDSTRTSFLVSSRRQVGGINTSYQLDYAQLYTAISS